MTSRQIDRLLGKQITVRNTVHDEQWTMTLVQRRPRTLIVESADGGVYLGDELQLVKVHGMDGRFYDRPWIKE